MCTVTQRLDSVGGVLVGNQYLAVDSETFGIKVIPRFNDQAASLKARTNIFYPVLLLCTYHKT